MFTIITLIILFDIVFINGDEMCKSVTSSGMPLYPIDECLINMYNNQIYSYQYKCHSNGDVTYDLYNNDECKGTTSGSKTIIDGSNGGYKSSATDNNDDAYDATCYGSTSCKYAKVTQYESCTDFNGDKYEIGVIYDECFILNNNNANATNITLSYKVICTEERMYRVPYLDSLCSTQDNNATTVDLYVAGCINNDTYYKINCNPSFSTTSTTESTAISTSSGHSSSSDTELSIASVIFIVSAVILIILFVICGCVYCIKRKNKPTSGHHAILLKSV